MKLINSFLLFSYFEFFFLSRKWAILKGICERIKQFANPPIFWSTWEGPNLAWPRLKKWSLKVTSLLVKMYSAPCRTDYLCYLASMYGLCYLAIYIHCIYIFSYRIYGAILDTCFEHTLISSQEVVWPTQYNLIHSMQ